MKKWSLPGMIRMLGEGPFVFFEVITLTHWEARKDKPMDKMNSGTPSSIYIQFFWGVIMVPPSLFIPHLNKDLSKHHIYLVL